MISQSEILFLSCIKMHISTDIERRSRTPIPLHVMASLAIELQLGYSGFCQPHMWKQTQSKCIHGLRAPYGISRVSIFMLRPQYIRTWRITVILIVGKTRIPLLWAPCWNKDGIDSGISGVYLGMHPRASVGWLHHWEHYYTSTLLDWFTFWPPLEAPNITFVYTIIYLYIIAQ